MPRRRTVSTRCPSPGDRCRRPRPTAGAAARAAGDEAWRHLTGWKRRLDLPEAGHLSFCDVHRLVDALGIREQLPPEGLAEQYGSIRGDRALAATRAYLGAFFDRHRHRHRHRHRLDRPGRLLDGPSAAYPEVRFAQ
ncbi:hypothetical protein [Kitasatospora sp. NPDC096204]|uniref:hypothetical protein n=1 Tax=Kitasatospora sp. NPDC096204 TaxID=3364094 RepID=UPI00380914AA